jgi:hypothetical protein
VVAVKSQPSFQCINLMAVRVIIHTMHQEKGTFRVYVHICDRGGALVITLRKLPVVKEDRQSLGPSIVCSALPASLLSGSREFVQQT